MSRRHRCDRPSRARHAILIVATALLLAAGFSPAAERLRVEPEGDRVTVHAADVVARDVVAALREAGLADLVGPAKLERRVTIHVESGTVERVMRQLLQQVEVTNHAVRYDAGSGLATFVVVDESGRPIEIAREDPPAEPESSEAPVVEIGEGPSPAELRGRPEKGFGRLLLGR